MKIVFDLDGTLTDPSHRLHHILSDPKDWDAFFVACGGDTPIEAAVLVCSDLSMWNEVEFWTGRPERTRATTVEWLQEHVLGDAVGECIVKMRADGDHRPDHVVKLEYVDPASPPDIIFEDRSAVVDAYRARGLTVYQVAPGNF